MVELQQWDLMKECGWLIARRTLNVLGSMAWFLLLRLVLPDALTRMITLLWLDNILKHIKLFNFLYVIFFLFNQSLISLGKIKSAHRKRETYLIFGFQNKFSRLIQKLYESWRKKKRKRMIFKSKSKAQKKQGWKEEGIAS